VVVPDQQLSLAIGRRGQNVRLASQLAGWDIDILTEQEESEQRQAEFEKRKALGVADELRQIEGITAQMMVALGEDGIKTIEDFAGCAADDLVGWTERKNGETKKFEGLFSKFDISRVEAEQMVVQARLIAGWITEEDLAKGAEAVEADAAEQDA